MPYLPFAGATVSAAVALAIGLICGFVNLGLIIHTGRRLADSGNAKPFVLSSLFRVGLFAIVAGVFAAVGPWWTVPLFIAGLFVPFALHVLGVARER
ncbi:MAG: hypothetical protein ABI282_05495 [Candidatus Baltobacteraceae bacterium]